eukprot:3414298-Alexandrium_andersonii.AAC.1
MPYMGEQSQSQSLRVDSTRSLLKYAFAEVRRGHSIILVELITQRMALYATKCVCSLLAQFDNTRN